MAKLNATGPWWEIAWWLNNAIADDPYYEHFTIGDGTNSIVRFQTKPHTLLGGVDPCKTAPIILANIIFRDDYIELYHFQDIDTRRIDIQDQNFLEKIIEWLHKWDIKTIPEELKKI